VGLEGTAEPRLVGADTVGKFDEAGRIGHLLEQDVDGTIAETQLALVIPCRSGIKRVSKPNLVSSATMARRCMGSSSIMSTVAVSDGVEYCMGCRSPTL
jgi:hypothetical protein